MAASTTFRCSSLSSACRLLFQKQTAGYRQLRFLSSSSQDNSASDAVSAAPENEERDPFPVFVQPRVQELLTRITGFDLMKVAGPQKKPLQRPIYKLMTDEQLNAELSSAKERLQHRLQMPPYMKPRRPHLTPLSVDPELAGFDKSSYVFVDISFGVKDRKRSVVIREVDGTLRVAPWDVKERMNQIYNPREGRHVVKPSMFEEANLERMISEKRYQYVLDRACCQFEPDDPDFIRTTHRVYNAVDQCGDYEHLRSTRHFGPLAFYLAWHSSIDGLLVDMLDRDKAQDARDVVVLFADVHPNSSCAAAISELPQQDDDVAVIKTYLSTDCKNKDKVELSLRAMVDSQRSKGKTQNSSL